MCVLLAAALLTGLAAGVCGAALPSWDFASARGPAGWTLNEDFADVHYGSEGLSAKCTGTDPLLIVSGLSVPCHIRQYVEVTLRAAHTGVWQFYWASSDTPPFGGFRSEKVREFTVPGGRLVTLRVYPFWQEDAAIQKIRLDPPEGAQFTLRSVRVCEAPGVASSGVKSWSFAKDAAGWTLMQVPSRKWWPAKAGGATLLSPPLDLDAEDGLWVSITMTVSTGETGVFSWVTSEGDGLQSKTFRLKADGRPHVYNLDLSGEQNWRGRIRALALAPSSSTNASVRLQSISIRRSRGGAAEVDVAQPLLHDVCVRAGTRAVLECVVTNTGGTASGPLCADLVLPSDVRLASGRRHVPLASLEAGAASRLSWTICAAAGEHPVSVRVRARSSIVADARSVLSFYPAMPRGGTVRSGYVPEPKPVSTPGFKIGCYYFPGWKTYQSWSVLEQFPERRPVLGYYREGDPEVADWHVKWALEHGVSFFIYDWYWCKGGRSLDHALHDGLFKSRYGDKFQFCLLWANHNPAGTSSFEDMEAVTRYWIANYFRRPQYLRVDGKPVVVIFSTYRFTQDMGVEGTRKAFDRAREICRQAGLPGLYLVACSYPDAGTLQSVSDEGYDAVSGYNYPSAGVAGGLRVAPYSDNVRGYPEFWQRIDAAANLPYIPVTDPGWDSRPWHGDTGPVRTGKSPALFRQMLQKAKEFEDAPGRKLPGGQKMVFVEAWNEFGEGDFVEPHRQFGFGFLDAIRDVFSGAPGRHVDLTPADVGRGPYDVACPVQQSAFEFDKSDTGCGYQSMDNVQVQNGCLEATTGADPAVALPVSVLDASRFRTLEVRMQVSAGQEGQFFWAGRGSLNEACSVRFPLKPGADFQVYRVDLTQARRWSGVIRQMRLDPTDASGASVRIDYIRLVR